MEFPKDVRERFDRIKKSAKADSLTEAIRRAMFLYEVLLQARAAGEQVVVRSGKSEREIVIV